MRLLEGDPAFGENYRGGLKLEELNIDRIHRRLKEHADEDYRAYTKKLVPTVPLEKIIGVRAPDIKALAAELSEEEYDDLRLAFGKSLPHFYYEENLMHAYLLSHCSDPELYTPFVRLVEEFLPHIDNWAVCDALNPKLFALHPKGLEEKISEWLRAEHAYTVRFALSMLMKNYLDEFFDEEHFQWVMDVASNDYYVQTMEAWYFATALAKRYEQTVPLLADEMLEPTVHAMTIQKAINSQRIPYERKKYLRTLK